MAVGVTRKGVVTFGIGLMLGFAVTYMLTFTMRYRKTLSGNVYSSAFIPNSPHSHGEMDQFRGPEETVNWADEHSHLHAGVFNSFTNYFSPFLKLICIYIYLFNDEFNTFFNGDLIISASDITLAKN